MKVIYSLLTAALAALGTPALAADALYVDSDTVRQVQKILTDRGFRTGGVDGRMGPQTQAALVNFQRAEKLQPTGKLDRQTLAALGVKKTEASSKYSAATIRKAQATLNARGFKAGAANGVMGDATRSALRAFQKSEGIVVTGSLNPRTLARLGIDDPRAAAAGSSR
jgi:peptidoglycan hydrolase-like protein with peptidoglycan-binding domain